MSMAQIGEFAFIVATLGLSLGVTSDFLFPVAVGASAITTFTTPYLIKSSAKLHELVERVLPPRWVAALNRYSTNAQSIQTESEWKVVLNAYIKIILTNSIILLGVMLLVVRVLVPYLSVQLGNNLWGRVLILVASLAVAAPFLWALMAKRPRNFAYRELWMDKKYNRGPLLGLEILRIVAGLTFITFLTFKLFSGWEALLVAVPLIVVILFIFAKGIQGFYQRIESRFMGNLNAREIAAENTLEASMSRKNADMQSGLQPWDAHIVEMDVPQEADYIGKPLSSLSWRETFGINLAYIKRGERIIHTPGRSNILLPYDQVGVIGTDEQLQQFKPVFQDDTISAVPAIDLNDIALQKIVVNSAMKLDGQDIRSSKLRELTDGLVVGIERDNERILNPDSSWVFKAGDVVWLVGNRNKIQAVVRGEVVLDVTPAGGS
jgi:CPA2 family monovalent cation:H+ antiporter-2